MSNSDCISDRKGDYDFFGIKIPYELLFKYIPSDTPDGEIDEMIFKALEYYHAHNED